MFLNSWVKILCGLSRKTVFGLKSNLKYLHTTHLTVAVRTVSRRPWFLCGKVLFTANGDINFIVMMQPNLSGQPKSSEERTTLARNGVHSRLLPEQADVSEWAYSYTKPSLSQTDG